MLNANLPYKLYFLNSSGRLDMLLCRYLVKWKASISDWVTAIIYMVVNPSL